MRVRALLAGLAAACCCAAVQAAGEHERRLAAEVTVMAGDVRRLMAGEGGPLEREGLVKRLNGALSSLPLLLRRAGAEAQLVSGMRQAHSRRDWRTLAAALTTLAHRHPFAERSLPVVAPTAEVRALGASIHASTCAACHDAPATDSLLPAKNLAKQMQGMSREEFAARLWLGVRGDKTTAFANPFSDAELAALIAWYASP